MTPEQVKAQRRRLREERKADPRCLNCAKLLARWWYDWSLWQGQGLPTIGDPFTPWSGHRQLVVREVRQRQRSGRSVIEVWCGEHRSYGPPGAGFCTARCCMDFAHAAVRAGYRRGGGA